MKFLYLIILTLTVDSAYSSLLFKSSGGYTSYDYSESKIAYTRLHGSFFVGAGIGRKGYFLLGPSYSIWTKSHKPNSTADAEEVSMGEFGATLIAYMNKAKNWKIELTYCPNITGTRTVSGTEQDIAGSSFMIDLGYHFNMTERFILGGSLGYYSTSIATKTISSTETEISESYTQIIPKLEVGLRF